MADFELVLVLLGAAAALQVLARRFGVPQPALLVLGGAALALVPGLPRPVLHPDVIFLMFVPPLLYFASIRAPVRELRQQPWPVFHLSVPLVLITMVLVAVVAHWLDHEFTWPAAFVLGAIIAPPDPIAAVAVMRPLRAPAALTAVLEGEGMFNDATALVAYRIAVGAAVSGVFSLGRAAAEFAWGGPLGIAMGLAIGWGILSIRRQVQSIPMVDNTISLLTPFAAYLAADALGGSGVLAVVAAGLYIGQHLSTTLSPASRVQTTGTWALVAFILENLVFILIGLELAYLLHATRPRSLGEWLALSAAISLAAILIRLVLVFSIGFFWRRTVETQASRRRLGVVAWMGVRGADSVVIALALPHLTASGAPFPGRGLIIFVTFGVVFSTLVLQGLTIGPLVRRFGLQGDTRPEQEEAHARHVMAGVGLERLEELAGRDGDSTPIFDELRHRYHSRARRWESRERSLSKALTGRHGPNPGKDSGKARLSSYRHLRASMIDAERQAVVSLRDRGVIGDDVLRRIERDLDLEVMLLEQETLVGPGPAPRSGKHRAASPAQSND